ncbi:LysM peptidoglycan-binding domain-containing protein [Flavobacterium amnicola]|uniref:LysM peptidoglycan-binding domain-containing protein n=1 Tax=Flavobacterium amnicola TaxID=2506422 RepID=A0A4Q1K795_9FLAO|nr:peptidoglycan endopeptidase [Flavobacterium amnicola]RXR20429.1 LysM peptidoglycan-binding domain-containing protein [Flavobacterium amnicola]
MSFQKHTLLVFILLSTVVFSQEAINHKVTKGETVYSLAQKYQVKQSEIFELNPKAKNGLKLDMVLQIPNKNQSIATVEPTVHEVLPKETLYGISKKYNVSIEKIKEANSFIETEGLKIGAKVTIPTGVSNTVVAKSKKEIQEVKKETPKKVEIAAKIEPKVNHNSSNEEIIHEVLAKETKYGISRKYGITIAELEALNPTIKSGLAIGSKLVIKNGVKKEATILEEKKEVATNETPIAENKKEKVEKTKSQFKIIGRVESDKNEEIVQVKPQIEETDEEASEVTQAEMPIEEVVPLSPENMTKAEFLIAKASENLGARYRSGATGNGGFDCSGLMFATFKNIEMTLPRSSRDMAANAGVRINKSQAQKGDLIFFATSGRGVSHVGMITEVLEDEIKFIHSSTSAGVIVSSTKEAYYAKRFVQVNRVLEN